MSPQVVPGYTSDDALSMVNLKAVVRHFVPTTTEGLAHVLAEEGRDLGPALVCYGSIGLDRGPEVV